MQQRTPTAGARSHAATLSLGAFGLTSTSATLRTKIASGRCACSPFSYVYELATASVSPPGEKGHARDGGRVALERADALLLGAVPHVDVAVAAARREGAVHGVEGDRVDGERRVDAAHRHAVALERVPPRLRLRGRVDVLDGDAPLDGAEREAVAGGHLRHAPRLVLERRLAPLHRLARPAQVDERDLAVGERRHEQRHRPEGRRRRLRRARARAG